MAKLIYSSITSLDGFNAVAFLPQKMSSFTVNRHPVTALSALITI